MDILKVIHMSKVFRSKVFYYEGRALKFSSLDYYLCVNILYDKGNSNTHNTSDVGDTNVSNNGRNVIM